MFLPPLVIKNLTIDPPLFLAPMAGITHSAFRRLIADFGGYGALYTEMLSGKALLHEKVGETPFTKKRDGEGIVWYQLALGGEENIADIVERIKPLNPAALDINAACPAPEILPRGFGAALFRNERLFTTAIVSVRRNWSGILTVKCRLGDDEPHWRETFVRRLSIMEREGVDAVIVHPRFFNEKLKRKARWDLFDWISKQTTLPVIANGDIISLQQVQANRPFFRLVKGLMVGRMSVVKPWIFRELIGDPAAVDYPRVWSTFADYVLEDFSKEKAFGRIKEFSKYFAQNFLFGHELHRAIQGAQTLEKIKEQAKRFFESNRKITENPTVIGL